MKRICDIIIPIYNAYEDLIMCIDSVKKFTDLSYHHLLLLDDCSTDERVSAYLKGLKETNIKVINNKENIGFSANINQGLKISQRDVVLLNSDTIVTENWLSKLIRSAYSKSGIATVTPLSNNATICSVPYMCKENQLPEGYTIDSFAAFINRVSLRLYPEIPTAIGFCMYIKRSVLNIVGDFDANTFARGYGEENDFCYRAIKKGFYHIMCDDTFIYHTGTASFLSDEKKAYVKTHSEILKQRYPEQFFKTDFYAMQNQNSIINDNIKIQLMLHNGNQNLLLYFYDETMMLDQNKKEIQENTVEQFVRNIGEKINLITTSQQNNIYTIDIYLFGKKTCIYSGNMSAIEVIGTKRKTPREFCSLILNIFKINSVHVLYSKNLSLKLCEIAKEIKIPVVVHLKDNMKFEEEFKNGRDSGWKTNRIRRFSSTIVLDKITNSGSAEFITKIFGPDILVIDPFQYNQYLKEMECCNNRLPNWVNISKARFMRFYQILTLCSYKSNIEKIYFEMEKYKTDTINAWELVEKYKTDTINAWELVEKYKTDTIDAWELVEKYKAEAASNWELVEKLQNKQ